MYQEWILLKNELIDTFKSMNAEGDNNALIKNIRTGSSAKKPAGKFCGG